MPENVYNPPEIASLLGLIDTHLRWKQLQNHGNREYHSYHPSELGKCLRAQQYKHFVQKGYIPSPEVVAISSQSQRLFDKGNNMHSRWQNWYFAEMGILRGQWKCTNMLCNAFDDTGRYRYNNVSVDAEHVVDRYSGKSRIYGTDDKLGCFKPEKCVCGCKIFQYCELPVVCEDLNTTGHTDMVLDFSRFDPKKYNDIRHNFNVENFPKKPIVIDLKTCGDWAWKNQVVKYGIHKEYIIQVTLYTHILDCEYGVVIYENKNDSTATAFKVERNDDLYEKLKKQLKMMVSMADKRLLPPPRPSDKSEMECKRCPFIKRCHESSIWKDDKLEEKRKMFYGSLL